jgi:hypothetical protein
VSRDPGFLNSFVFLDSGFRDALHRSSGMTAFLHCDTASEGEGECFAFIPSYFTFSHVLSGLKSFNAFAVFSVFLPKSF